MNPKNADTKSGFKTERASGDKKKIYGHHALVTSLGKINVIHLDRPSVETIQKRIDEVLRETITGEAFDDDCPLCQDLKNRPYDIIYNGDEG